jgi:tRNA nucleotidyltransferase (CCA-adding enzyme)
MKAKIQENFPIPEEVIHVDKTLKNAGFQSFLVGGCVRDLLLNKPPKDWDLTTNARPDDIIKLFQKTFYENSYGTVGVVNEETKNETLKIIEVTPYRLEAEYSDNRRPDHVTFSDKIEDDLKRRDFTVNAIALEIGKEGEEGLYKGHIIDLYKGQEDLAAKTLKAVGDPDERLSEDALRSLRAIRLATELGFTINIATEKAIKTHATLLEKIAKERIRDEFSKIIMSNRPMDGLILANKLGILKYALPEIEKGIGIDQNKAHSYDVWEHSLRSLQHAADKKWPLEIRVAALLHDVGKPATRRFAEDKKEWTFYGHEVVGTKIAVKALENLKFPRKTIEMIAKLVRWHMFFSDTEQITLSAVRRIVARVGKEHIWDLMNLRICDRIGTGRPKESPYRLRKYHSMIEEVMNDPISVGMLKINGAKLMEITKCPPSPKIGHILHALLQEVLENPKLNEAEILEKRALELAKLPEKELMKLGEEGKEKKEEEQEKNVEEIRKKYWVK